MESQPRHHCLIYHGAPSRQLPILAATMRRKLEENYRCLYLNSPAMVAGLRSCLAVLGSSVVDEVIKGSLVLSSDSTLSADGSFDIKLMIDKLEDALDRALEDGYKGLWATGDMSWEFGDKKNFGKLLEYEWQLEELFRKRPELCGICQYHHDTLPLEIMRMGLISHQSLFVNETLAGLNPHYIQSRVLAERESKNPELDKIVMKLCQSQDNLPADTLT